MIQPGMEFLFRMNVTMGEGVQLGQTPYGNVSFQHAIGGDVSGPRIKGKLLPIGGDRVVGRTDGVAEINVQALIRTDDNHDILMSYRGIIRGIPQPGQPMPDPPSIYWRTAPMFETSADPYLWMNGILAIGVGQFGQGTVHYDIFSIL